MQRRWRLRCSSGSRSPKHVSQQSTPGPVKLLTILYSVSALCPQLVHQALSQAHKWHHQELESRLASVAGFREQQGSIAREMQYLRNERDRAKQEVADQVHYAPLVQDHGAPFARTSGTLALCVWRAVHDPFRPGMILFGALMQTKAHAATMQQLQAALQQEHKEDTARLIAQHADSLEADLDTRAAKVRAKIVERYISAGSALISVL